MLCVSPIARQGRHNDAMPEFEAANLDGSEELRSRHGIDEFSNEL